MVPGLQVARHANNSWAVSARGFAGRFSNKLLVQMDGRSLYSPLFSGVMWEAQDVLLQDIERIEVIRGPGAALWGANAVNGIINIITKKARDTKGGYAELAVGSEEKSIASLRYGGEVDEDTQYRAYARGHFRDESVTLNGEAGADNSRSKRGGFRVDRRISAWERLTVSGDAYEAHSGDRWVVPQLVPPYGTLTPMSERNRGANIVARYERDYADGSSIGVQAYVDSTRLAATPFVYEDRDTFDFDFQHRLPVGSLHDVIWGLNYRVSKDEVSTPGFIQFFPGRETFELFSVFVHDDITLVPDRLNLILGSKIEYNSFTGTEPQPNARVRWKPAEGHTFWAAASRAARIPSRAERESVIDYSVTPPLTAINPTPLPLFVRSTYHPGIARVSEKVNAYEIGYRTQLTPQLSVDLAAFSNHYSQLRSVSSTTPGLQLFAVPHVLQDVYMDNALSGNTSGFEASLDWRPAQRWRVQTSYSYLRMRFDMNGNDAHDNMAQMLKDAAPRNQVSLRSMLDIAPRQQFDLWVRYVSQLTRGDIPAYTTLDARYAWQPRKDLEFALVGQNLLDNRHPEFMMDFVSAPVMQVQRAFYVQTKVQF